MYCSSWIPPYLIWKVLWCLLLIVCEQSPWNDCFLGDGYLLFFLKLCSRHLLKFLQTDKKLDTFRLDLCHNISHPVCRGIGTATLIQQSEKLKRNDQKAKASSAKGMPLSSHHWDRRESGEVMMYCWHCHGSLYNLVSLAFLSGKWPTICCIPGQH